MPISSHDIGPSLIKALGLPKRTVSFELRCAVDEFVTVQCKYHPDLDGDCLELLLSNYALYAVGGTVSVQPPRLMGDAITTGIMPADAIGFDAWLLARNNAAHDAMVQRHSRLARMDARLAA